jgi:lysophospholipase L1-like esterase
MQFLRPYINVFFKDIVAIRSKMESLSAIISKKQRSFTRSIPFLVTAFVVFHSADISAQGTKKWVGSWSTAPQLVETANMPPSPGLTNNSLRQIVRVSIGGDTLRIKFSNDFSTSAVKINAASIAVPTSGGSVNASTMKELKFSGNKAVTMDANSSVYSDPVAFNLTPGTNLAITIYFGQTSTTVTGHPGSRTTSYIIAGDKTASADLSGAVKTEHWYVINTIDVFTSNTAAAIAILGNSITDGRGSTTDSQNRWPDILSGRLLKNAATQQIGVLNLGVGGNCVLSGGLGQPGVNRYQRDILNQSGVRWVIIFIGVNDIGTVKNASAATSVASDLIAAYKKFITDAKAKNMMVYGATIMPFNGNDYYNQYSESCRKTVNAWIRTGGSYDSIIDFDKVTRGTSDTTKLGIASYQNDGLHPDAAGYVKMGEAISLKMFSQDVNVTNSIVHKSLAAGKMLTNSCNGTTRVTFEIPCDGFVSLKVYSILGKEIAELAGKNFHAGKHTVTFENGGLARGMYVVSLLSGKIRIKQKFID